MVVTPQSLKLPQLPPFSTPWYATPRHTTSTPQVTKSSPLRYFTESDPSLHRSDPSTRCSQPLHWRYRLLRIFDKAPSIRRYRTPALMMIATRRVHCRHPPFFPGTSPSTPTMSALLHQRKYSTARNDARSCGQRYSPPLPPRPKKKGNLKKKK